MYCQNYSLAVELQVGCPNEWIGNGRWHLEWMVTLYICTCAVLLGTVGQYS